MQLEKLLAVAGVRHGAHVLVVHVPPKWAHIARLFETLDGCLAAAGKHHVPSREDAYYQTDNAGDDGEHDELDGHEAVDVARRVVHDLEVAPCPGDGKAVQGEGSRVEQEE